MSRQVLIKGVTYNIVTGDRNTFVGRYIGPSPEKDKQFFDIAGQQRGFDGITSFFSQRRDKAPRLHYSQFAKAHWSVLVYSEERVVRHSGYLSADHLRVNPEKHQVPQGTKPRPWDSKAGGTVIKGVPGLVRGYDDYDVLDDLIWGGFVCRESIKNNDKYHLTERGWAVASQLRRYLAENEGSYDRFIPRITDQGPTVRSPRTIVRH